jgi:hypothetical protein
MSCSGSHLGIPINIINTKFVKDLPMIDAQFRFNQCNSFREENISVYSHMVLCGGHFGFQIITKNTNLIRNHSMIIHAQNGFIQLSSF